MKKIIFLFLFSSSLFAQIDRIEPPFWYANMQNPEVQIVFYGKNIAENEVAVSNNVIINNIRKTENPNYLFVTINTKNVAAQELTFSFSKNSLNRLVNFILCIFSFVNE